MVDQATIAGQLKDRARRIIKADGTILPVLKPLRIGTIEAAIGASTTDTVNLRHLGQPLVVMFVDDHGYDTELVDHGEQAIPEMGGLRAHLTERRPTRARKPVNEIATALYHANCRPGTTHQSVGDVFIAPDEDFA